MKGIITKYRRSNLAKITSGMISTIPKITHIAFGDGGEVAGVVQTPSEIQESLFHEVKRYPVTSKELIGETTVRYSVDIPESDMKDVRISEMALVDDAGKVCALKTFGVKVKDENIIFGFEFDDEY